MTIEKIYKLAQRKFKDLDIDDLHEPCMYAIDNMYETNFVVMLRLNPSSYDKLFEEPSFIVFGGDNGGSIFYEKLFFNHEDAKEYYYDLFERLMIN